MKKVMLTLLALALGMTAFAQYGGGPGGRYGERPGGSMGGGMGGPPPGGRGPGQGSGYRYTYRERGTFECGISLNHFTGNDKENALITRPDRVGLFGEYRADLGNFVDFGLQVSTTFGKGTNNLAETWYWQAAPLVVTDLNLLPYSGFTPYFGIGIGPGFAYEYFDAENKGTWIQSLVIAPRAGLELFERVRMSVTYQWYLSGSQKFSHFSFGISWAFGPMISARPIRGR